MVGAVKVRMCAVVAVGMWRLIVLRVVNLSQLWLPKWRHLSATRLKSVVPRVSIEDLSCVEACIWLQMLVYENYNKFISATDTIRNMKVNVDGMDASMQDLRIRLGAPPPPSPPPPTIYCLQTPPFYCTLGL